MGYVIWHKSTGHNPPAPESPTNIVIDDSQNGSIVLHTTLNVGGSHMFHEHDNLGGVPANVEWSITTLINNLIQINSSTGMLTWSNNLDPDANYSFTLICHDNDDLLEDATCVVQLEVVQTPGNDICPNSWFDVDANGMLSLKSGIQTNNIYKLVIPNQINGTTITSLGYRCFFDLPNLTSVDFSLATSISALPRMAFAQCTSLRYVNLGSISSIGDACFLSCSSLTSITLFRVNQIEREAFRLSGITSIYLSSIQSIPDFCFQECWSLQTVVLSPNTTSIGMNAFAYDPLLSGINLYSIPTVGQGAFQFCSSLNSINANYDSQPSWLSNSTYIFSEVAPVGTVSNNTSGSYTSANFLTDLQNNSELPEGWTTT